LRPLGWGLFKLAKLPAPYLGIVLCLVFSASLLGGFLKNNFRALQKYGQLVDPSSLVSASSFSSFAINIGFFAVLPILVAMVAASQLAGEAKDGTLRAWMMRPIGRVKVVASKWFATYLWCLGLVTFLALISYVIGSVALGQGNMLVYVWQLRAEGIWFVSTPEWIGCLGLVILGVSVSLMVIGSLAMFVSSMVHNPLVALVSAIGVFFVSSSIGNLPDEVFSAVL